MDEKKINLKKKPLPLTYTELLFKQPIQKITRVRIPEDVIQNKTLINHIENLIGSKIKLESYRLESDFRKSFSNRQASLFKACQYIISTLIPLEKKADMLKTLKVITQNHCMPNVDCPANYQKILVNYKQRLIGLCTLYLKNKEKKEVIGLINKAEQYVILQEGRHDLVTITRCKHGKFNGFSMQWEQQFSAFDAETLKEFNAIKANKSPPQWFLNLSMELQIFLNQLLQSTKTVEEALLFLSSRQRELPGIPNFAQRTDLLLDESGQLIKKYAPIWRSGHLASRDIQTWPEEIQAMYCQRNYNMILKAAQNKPVYIGTLISPNVIPLAKSNLPFISNISNMLDNMIPMVVSLPDKKLNETLLKTINETKTSNKIYFTNHPQNMARASDYTAAHDPNCLDILHDAKQLSEKNPQLKPLIEVYENALNAGFGSSYLFDFNGRELNLAAAECLLILEMGGFVHITCVSGKDRTALVLLYIQAMRNFHQAYGIWPLYSDIAENRTAFVDIFVEIYCSGHGQTFAGDNAKGSNDLKTPDTYLPSDIVLAIKKILGEHCFKDADMLASNNEFGKIKSKTNLGMPIGSKDYYPACFHAAKKLSVEQCEKLINQLKLLTCDNQFWQGKKQRGMFASITSYVVSDVPEGIRQLKMILTKPNEEKNSNNAAFKMLALVYVAILNRPDNSEQRNGITAVLYELIKNLCAANIPSEVFDKTMEEISKIKSLAEKELELISSLEKN